MKRFFEAILGSLLLLVSVTSCGKISPTVEQVVFDSLRVDTICPLFKNYEKPACHIQVKLEYPADGYKSEFSKLFEQFLTDNEDLGSLSGGYETFDELARDHVRNYLIDYLNEGPSAIDNYGEDIEASSFWMSYEETVDGSVLYNDDAFISYKLSVYSYTGGAHGVINTSLGVFNLATNKRICLADICDMTRIDELNQLLRERLLKLHDCDNYEDLMEKVYFFSPAEIEATEKFYVNNEGVNWYFDPYEIAPMSVGEVIIPLSWTELLPLLDDLSPLADMAKKYASI